MTTTATKPTTHTVTVPGATLTYDVRRNDASAEPMLFLIGSPMGAAGFGTLSGHFGDRTVVTYDPRSVERSEQTNPTSPPTPEQHADDLYRIIGALGGGPVDLFGSSGGAVNGLALVTKHPDDVRTLVAHEPPLPVDPSGRQGGTCGSASCPRHVRAARLGRGDGPFHRGGEPPRSVQR